MMRNLARVLHVTGLLLACGCTSCGQPIAARGEEGAIQLSPGHLVVAEVAMKYRLGDAEFVSIDVSVVPRESDVSARVAVWIATTFVDTAQQPDAEIELGSEDNGYASLRHEYHYCQDERCSAVAKIGIRRDDTLKEPIVLDLFTVGLSSAEKGAAEVPIIDEYELRIPEEDVFLDDQSEN